MLAILQDEGEPHEDAPWNLNNFPQHRDNMLRNLPEQVCSVLHVHVDRFCCLLAFSL